MRRADDLGLTHDQLSRAHDVISSAMGADWIEQQEALRARRTTTVAHAHPLFIAMGSSTDPFLLEIAELATYLTEFKDDARLPQTITSLRDSDKYGATVFELAMAYRWKTAGAIVTLEPPTPRGRRADFDAVIDSTKFMVECSIFPNNIFATDESALMQFLMNAMPEYEFSITLEVEIESVPDGDFFGAVGAAVRKASREFERAFAGSKVTTDFGTISIHKTNIASFDEEHPLADGRWTIAARASSKTPNPGGSMYDVHLNPDVAEHGWILVRMPDERADPYRALERKFKREYDQLAGVTEPRVILLDATGLNANAYTFDMRRLNDSIGQVVLDKPKVAALWIMSRMWTTFSRYHYRAITINNPNTICPLPLAFFDLLNEREGELDYLTGKRFPE